MQAAPVGAGYHGGKLVRTRLHPIPWKGQALQSPDVLAFATENHVQGAFTFGTLTLKAFSLSVRSVVNTVPTTLCSFLGFRRGALQFTESAHQHKCMPLLWMLISRSKGNSKGLVQLNMCARYKNRMNRAFSEFFQIQTT